jgi:hypothetical protein
MRDSHLSDELLLRSLDRELPAGALPRLAEHLEGCGDCRARLESLRVLSAALEGYADSLTDARPDGPQRASLAAGLDGRTVWRPVVLEPRRPAPVLAAAAAILVSAMALALMPKQPGPPRVRAPIAAAVPAPVNGFIALPYSDENLTPEGAVVIQVEVPRSALLLTGTPVSEPLADGRVRAEVIVGADGLARAIRFLN